MIKVNGEAEYLEQIPKLMPRGLAWTDDELAWLAAEMARLDAHLYSTYINLQPDKTSDLLEKWEKDWGLPDPCYVDNGNLSDRRDALVAKIRGVFNPTKTQISDIVFAITGKTNKVIEGDVFRMGSRMMDRLSNADFQHTFTVKLDTPCKDAEDVFRMGSRMMDRLWAKDELPSVCDKLIRCVLDKYTPLHLRYFIES